MRFNPTPSLGDPQLLSQLLDLSQQQHELNRDLNGALTVEIIARCPATADVDARHTAAELGIRLSFAGRNYKQRLILDPLASRPRPVFLQESSLALSIKTERHEIAKKSIGELLSLDHYGY